jgi:catechol 2,3-dioxygenase-like lactoylglutathione lyase family enzyme
MIRSLYSVAVMVSNGKRAARWYKEKLGFKVYENKEHWITVAPKGSKFTLHLCQANKEWGYKLEPGNSGIAMAVDSLDKTYKELSAQGVRFSQKPIDQGWGKYASFKDLDRNEFTLYER